MTAARKQEANSSRSKLPLDGIRVLDVSLIWAGPHATRLLGDLGAEVIKVESLRRPDVTRGQHPADNIPGEKWWERGWTSCLHRNKYGITLDLNTDEGIVLFKRLVKLSDVVIENFSPRVMQNFGLDYPVLSSINPELIMISMSAFGPTGPYRDYVGYGHTIEAVAGLASLVGYKGGPPRMLHAAFSDPTSGFFAAGAILAAIYWRDLTGQGQFIDLSEMDVVMSLLGIELLDFTINGRVAKAGGNMHPWMAPHGCYRCRGKDEWVSIVAQSDEEWQRLCRVIDRPELITDSRFSDVVNRMNNREELDNIIEHWTGEMNSHEVMKILQQHGITSGAVQNTKQVWQNQHLKVRGAFELIERRHVGRRMSLGAPFKLPKTPISVRRPGPTLGQDNEFVLHDLLGLSHQEIDHLTQLGIIGNEPPHKVEGVANPIEAWQRAGALNDVDQRYLKELGLS